LSEAEVEKMIKDAEAHQEADKKRRELVEVRNQADALVHETDKQLREHGDKLSAETRRDIETAVEDLKKARDGEDVAAIKSATDKLNQAAAKLGEEVYKAASQQQAGAAGAAGAAGGAGTSGAEESDKSEEGTVEAEYEVVDEDKDGSR
jgi:molecular chaperone DnaK